MSSSSLQVVMLLLALFSLSALVAASAGNFGQDFDITWGNDHVKMLDEGRFLILSLDNTSGSAFQSKNEYLFGRIDMQIKLVSGNSAGTVTTYYVSFNPFLTSTSKILLSSAINITLKNTKLLQNDYKLK